jgi:cytochrome P450
VFYSPEHDCWLVTRNEDARTVLGDPSTFSSASAFTSHLDLPAEVLEILGEGKFMEANPVNLDPPVHTPIRRIWGRALLRRRVEEMDPMIHAVAHGIVDGFAGAGRVELMGGFAFPLPASVVLCGLLGVPFEELPDHMRWGRSVAVLLGASAPVETLVDAAHAHVEHRRYWEAQLEERRRSPRDDLLTAFVEECAAEPDIDLDTARLAYLPLGLSAAGQVTTAQAIAFGTLLFVQHPEQRAAALGDPQVMHAAVEEILRFESPVQMLRRTTTRATEIAGVGIPAGAQVMAVTCSGNRDATAFDGDPSTFDIGRDDAAEHMSFGRGAHFCLGAALARHEIAVALEVMFTRLPGLRLDGDGGLERIRHSFHRGFERVDLAWDASGPS